MRVSLKWLQEYVDIGITVDALAQRMTMAGVEIAAIERTGATWDRDKILVGQITARAAHPNADRLQLVTADYGRGVITIVTGAWNLEVGDKVPVALLGARLLNGHSEQHEEVVLKPTKLRGVPSEGMVCSALELGLGEDHAGIMILPADAPIGAALVDYLGDSIFVLEIKGRWDCLSMLGVAQEAAALQRIQLNREVALRQPPADYPEPGEDVNRQVTIEIQDPDLCPRYSATLIRGIKIGPSPRWLQERLVAAGMRPINNVVDVTNYVMWETGQPLHAFDYDRIQGKKIIVRRAHPGETIVSLDGQLRELAPDMCLICDAERAVAIGGVMGGLDSEVTDATCNILLEAANFLPASIRRTARRLQIPSEAQRRFEKGLPAEGTIPAARRATRLMLELGGGAAAKGVADAYPGRTDRPDILLTTAEVKRLLGVDLPMPEVWRVLQALGFTLQAQNADSVRARAPLRRVDCTIPADLTEELARTLSYDIMPTTMMSTPIPMTRLSGPERAWEELLRDTVAGCGYSEVILYSLTNQRSQSKLLPAGDLTASTVPESLLRTLLNEKIEPLHLVNPLSEEINILRTTAVPGLLDTLSRNLRHEDQDAGIFEIGRVYLAQGDDLPEERRVLTLASGQYRSAPAWGQRQENDFFDIKGVAETILAAAGLQSPAFRASYASALHPSFHPGRLAVIAVERSTGRKGKQSVYDPPQYIGLLGEVHPDTCQRFDIDERAFVLALDVTLLIELAGPASDRSGGYRPLPRFPAVMQDMAVIVNEGVAAARIDEVMQRAGGGMVAGIRLFDIYQGDPIAAGKKSLAYSITYQIGNRTLTGDEVAKVHARIEKELERELDAQIRK
jgi:phenylalanyl-tRNA synthetase beta chain